MRIYTKAGDLAFKTFTFPDGQPHFILETYERDFDCVTIEMGIKSCSDLLMALLVSDVLRQHGYGEVRLDVRYLLAARMDRATSSMEPFSLAVVARLLNGAGFSRVRILDVHSEVATRLIRNSSNVLPVGVVRQVYQSLPQKAKAIVAIAPDKGAESRVYNMVNGFMNWAACRKVRNPKTGALSGFEVPESSMVEDCDCLIVDDICDGGGTFVGLAKELREAGAEKIYLFVTHGIFSKGLPLDGIDHVYTTDTFFTEDVLRRVYWDGMRDILTTIPISMKELP